VSFQQVVYVASTANDPQMLKSLSAESAKVFLRSMEQYAASGGTKPWTAFISPGLRAFSAVSVFDHHPTDQELLAYLQQIARQTPDDVDAIKERIKKIKIDSQETTAVGKVSSLLISMEEALLELSLAENLPNPDTYACVPLDTHIELIMEKLPRGLQTKVAQRMKFLPKITSKRVFTNLLMDESKKYEWPKKG
jgi:hypothetical protein